MTETRDVSLPKGVWTLVAQGVSSATVQRKSFGPVFVVVDQEAPMGGFRGVRLDHQTPGIEFMNLGAADQVWAHAPIDQGVVAVVTQ